MKLSWEQKRSLEDTLVGCLTGAICATILFILAMLFVDAWIKEDTARVERLNRHQYEITMQQSQEPTGNFSPPQFTPERKKQNSNR